MSLNIKTYNLLIGVTGSVATIKLTDLIKEFKLNKNDKLKFIIRVVCTNGSLHFINELELKNLEIDTFKDIDEWNLWSKIGDPILHIQLREWADMFLISPLDANTLAKLCNGICDNLLTCIVRAWDLKKKLFFAPAMNTFMYDHPLTSKQINNLQGLGYIEIPVIFKKLACGDTGLGAMADVKTIYKFIRDSIHN